MLPFFAAPEDVSVACDSDSNRLELVRLYNEVKYYVLYSLHELLFIKDHFILFNKNRDCGKLIFYEYFLSIIVPLLSDVQGS